MRYNLKCSHRALSCRLQCIDVGRWTIACIHTAMPKPSAYVYIRFDANAVEFAAFDFDSLKKLFLLNIWVLGLLNNLWSPIRFNFVIWYQIDCFHGKWTIFLCRGQRLLWLYLNMFSTSSDHPLYQRWSLSHLAKDSLVLSSGLNLSNPGDLCS